MTVAVVATGLVTPIGRTPDQHALYPRTGLGLLPSCTFVDRAGAPVPIVHAPWLGARLPVADRLGALATEALAPVALALRRAAVPSDATRLLAVTSADRPGVAVPRDGPRASRSGPSNAAVESLVRAAERAVGARVVGRLAGAAGAFAALVDAADALGRGLARAVVVVAADSFVSIETARERSAHPASPWWRDPPPGSEGAAALLLMSPDDAQRSGLGAEGVVPSSAARRGNGSDDDDVAVDGVALGDLVVELSTMDVFARTYGQSGVDALRMRDWGFAAARAVSRLHAATTAATLEVHTGTLGAASGVASLAYALACERLFAAREHAAGAGPVLVWAIGADGLRGACAVAGAR